MKKIIHLSDLHIGFEDLLERFERIADNLIALMCPASDYIIVITGDLVEKPVGTDQYRQARQALDRLEAAEFRVLVIPGNHDYNNGTVLEKDLVPCFKETFFGDPHVQYPKVDLVAGIAFLGLDSMAEELHWYDNMFADGELGDAQLQRLDALLGDSAVRACTQRVVYLHHHPFDPLPLGQLKDAHKMERILRAHGNVDALLFGHNHLGGARNGRWDIPRCYDAGTATGKFPGVRHYRVIDFSLPPAQDRDADLYEVHASSWIPAESTVAPQDTAHAVTRG